MRENLFSEVQARRDFLKKAGRFAAVTPPAITLLLGTSLNSTAIARSGGSPQSNSGGSTPSNGGGGSHFHPRPFGQGLNSGGRGGGDNYGGGGHGGSRSGDPD
ncbi:hypothetical protein [Mesorhizobium sp.]|uniref:hypothetical protein n=1 Tax=Mesorhizobium sp. TaxID=1871066 RepID=UPI0025C66E2A|nr:hypothetical protein [Mesorhizobium sp.]